MRAAGERRGGGQRLPALPLLAGALALALLAAACGRDREEVRAELRREAATSAPDAIYTVRGVVWQLPNETQPELTVHHEAIPEFVSREGERSGMDSMTMPFAVAPGVSLDGIAEGDKVDMTFELRWEGQPTLLVTRLAELPAGTELQFGPGAPSPAASPGEPEPDAAPGATPATR